MVLGKRILGKNGEMLLNKNSVLRESYIIRIQQLGYNGVYVEDEFSDNIEIKEIITEDLRTKTVNTVRHAFISIENGKSMSSKGLDEISSLVDDIVKNVLDSKDIMVNMIDLKTFDDYTFYHSVNVAVLSLVVGVAMNLNKVQLNNLGLAAVLHDIGKVFVPKEILNKPGALSDEEFDVIKTHPYEGYIYLKEKFNIPTTSYIGILQHHERYDGLGYPMALKGQGISLYGRIVSLADVYDALTSRRPYRDALSPSEAIEYIMGGGGSYFDPVIASCFAGRIAPYPIGTSVQLSNNKIGIVVENYSDCSIRPRIKIIMDKDKTINPYFIDLKNDTSTLGITITGIAYT